MGRQMHFSDVNVNIEAYSYFIGSINHSLARTAQALVNMRLYAGVSLVKFHQIMVFNPYEIGELNSLNWRTSKISYSNSLS